MAWLHKIAGFVVLLIAQITILFGVFSYEYNYGEGELDGSSGHINPLGVVHLAIFYATWLVVEIVH